MNNLFATWHHGADVDLGDGPERDIVGLLARAETGLAGIPELDGARRLVAAALADVSAWAAPEAVAGSTLRFTVRSTSYAGSR